MNIAVDKTVRSFGDVFYEVSELFVLYRDFYSQNQVPADELFRNALLEKALMHIRNLLDFFELSRSVKKKDQRIYDDDLLAEDYGFSVNELGLPDDVRGRINKRIAHLTYSRATLTPNWNINEIVPPILARSGHFFQHLIKIKFTCAEKQQEDLVKDLSEILLEFDRESKIY